MSFDNRRTSAMDGKSTSSASNQSGGDTQSQTASASVPIMCRNGCGFYANSAFDGMCSKCFKDLSQQKSGATQLPSNITPTTTSTGVQTALLPTATVNSSSVDAGLQPALPSSLETGLPTVLSNASLTSRDSTATLDSTDNESEVGDTSSDSGSCGKPKKKRCAMCKKRVGLTGFDCRCGGHYCSAHRYSDAHNCGFNYHALAQTEIRRHNPVVAAEKVKKI